MRLLIFALALSVCVPVNPNVNTYTLPRYTPPDPGARSFLGYDLLYEQRLLDRYVATHQSEVSDYRRTYGW